MPKVNSKFTVIAHDEMTLRQERIKPALENRIKYKDVGARRPVYKPKHRPLKRTPLTAEELAEINREWKEEVATNAKVAALIQARDQLDRQIKAMQEPEPTPLIDRIEREPYKIPEPVPQHLKFQQKKICKQKEEVLPLFNAAVDRILPVCNKMLKAESGPSNHPGLRLTTKERKDFWAWSKELQDRKDEVQGYVRWTNKKWRATITALKKCRGLDLTDPQRQCDENVRSILGSGIVWP